MLGDAGVANPENIADYVHLLPRNTFSATTNARGETEITAYAADGRSYTISEFRLLNQSDDTIAFQADVDGWSVEGLLSRRAANQVALEFQFQVPLDIYESPPRTVIIKLGPSYDWLPTPIEASGNRDGDIGPFDVAISGLYATDCKCIGKGIGDGACVAKDCADGNACGDTKECLETEVGGSSFLDMVPTLLGLLGLFAYFGSRRCLAS